MSNNIFSFNYCLSGNILDMSNKQYESIADDKNSKSCLTLSVRDTNKRFIQSCTLNKRSNGFIINKHLYNFVIFYRLATSFVLVTKQTVIDAFE